VILVTSGFLYMSITTALSINKLSKVVTVC